MNSSSPAFHNTYISIPVHFPSSDSSHIRTTNCFDKHLNCMISHFTAVGVPMGTPEGQPLNYKFKSLQSCGRKVALLLRLNLRYCGILETFTGWHLREAQTYIRGESTSFILVPLVISYKYIGYASQFIFCVPFHYLAICLVVCLFFPHTNNKRRHAPV